MAPYSRRNVTVSPTLYSLSAFVISISVWSDDPPRISMDSSSTQFRDHAVDFGILFADAQARALDDAAVLIDRHIAECVLADLSDWQGWFLFELDDLCFDDKCIVDSARHCLAVSGVVSEQEALTQSQVADLLRHLPFPDQVDGTGVAA